MKRRLGLLAVFSISTGAMFSSGLFLLPGFAVDETGPSVPLVYAIAGLCVIPAMLSVAELSSAMPRAGGPYVFFTRGFGTQIGTIGALGKYVQLLLKGAFAFVGFGAYLTLLVDLPVRLVAVALIAVFTLINLGGMRQTARTEIGLVSTLLLLLAYFTIAGATEMATDLQAVQERFRPFLPHGVDGLLSAVALVFVSYAGLGQVASVAEEIQNPSRSIPRGILLSLAVGSFFYIAGTTAMIAVVQLDALRDDPTPVATAAEQFQTLPLPTWVVVVAALSAFASTGNAAILSAARYPFALARDGLLWSGFCRLSQTGVPRAAVLCTGAGLALLVAIFDIESIAKSASAFVLLVSAGFCVAVMVFRHSKTDYRPGFRSPLYPWTQLAGVILYAVLIVESGLAAILFITGVVAAGSAWYHFAKNSAT